MGARGSETRSRPEKPSPFLCRTHGRSVWEVLGGTSECDRLARACSIYGGGRGQGSPLPLPPPTLGEFSAVPIRQENIWEELLREGQGRAPSGPEVGLCQGRRWGSLWVLGRQTVPESDRPPWPLSLSSQTTESVAGDEPGRGELYQEREERGRGAGTEGGKGTQEILGWGGGWGRWPLGSSSAPVLYQAAREARTAY